MYFILLLLLTFLGDAIFTEFRRCRVTEEQSSEKQWLFELRKGQGELQGKGSKAVLKLITEGSKKMPRIIFTSYLQIFLLLSLSNTEGAMGRAEGGREGRQERQL